MITPQKKKPSPMAKINTLKRSAATNTLDMDYLQKLSPEELEFMADFCEGHYDCKKNDYLTPPAPGESQTHARHARATDAIRYVSWGSDESQLQILDNSTAQAIPATRKARKKQKKKSTSTLQDI